MKYDTQTQRQRAEDLTNEVMQHLGAREVAKIFREGGPDYGTEPVKRPDVLGIISDDPENGITSKTIIKAAVNSDAAFTVLLLMVLQWAEKSISLLKDKGPEQYKRAVIAETNHLAFDWLDREIIQRQFDIVQERTYDHPSHYAREIALKQIVTREYKVDNYDSRLRLWDELISFTRYTVKVEYEITEPDGTCHERSHQGLYWHQSQTKLNNQRLGTLRRTNNAEVDSNPDKQGENRLDVLDMTITPELRYTNLEPLIDTEWLVYSL